MKKLAILLAAFIAFSMNVSAQIPNNGFENWTPYGNGLNPEGWYSTNEFLDPSGSYFGVTRSEDHYPVEIGSYSIRIQNNIALFPDWGSMGVAWSGDFEGNDNPAFPISGHPYSFCGYYKFLPQNRDTMRIFICLYKNGAEVLSGRISDTITVRNWTPFIIPFQTYPDADSARIFLSSFNSEGEMVVQGNSVLYVDNLSFDNLINSVDQYAPGKDFCLIYPNPAAEFVVFKKKANNSDDLRFSFYNVMGRLVLKGLMDKNEQQINIGSLNDGIYLVEIYCGGGVEYQKLIIQR